MLEDVESRDPSKAVGSQPILFYEFFEAEVLAAVAEETQLQTGAKVVGAVACVVDGIKLAVLGDELPDYGGLADIDWTALAVVLLKRRHQQMFAFESQRIREDRCEMILKLLLLEDFLDEEGVGVARDDASVPLRPQVVQQFAHTLRELGTADDSAHLFFGDAQLVEFVEGLCSGASYELHELGPLRGPEHILEVLGQLAALEQLVDYGVRVGLDERVVEVEDE